MSKKKQEIEIIDSKQTKITDWYDKLLDDLWELAQTKVIEFKHQIGKRIIQDQDKFGKKEHGSKFMENLAKDLQISSTDLYRCVQFASMFPKLEELYTYVAEMPNSPTRGKIPWRWIAKELLPEHKKETETPPIEIGENYSILYCDPPWKYDFSETTNREIEQKYPTMELEEIKNIEIKCNDNAVLFMWATAPKLREALELMDAWNFEYKTHAIWDKQKIGMGYWFRGQHELLIVGVKGEFSPPEQEDRVSSVISIKRTKHSKKPDEIRDLISKWYPRHKKIELFAREKHEGWDVWGNEV